MCDQLNGALDPSEEAKTKDEQMEKVAWKLAEQVLRPICARPLEKGKERDFRESINLFYRHFWNDRNVKLTISEQSGIPQCNVYPDITSPAKQNIAWQLWLFFKIKGYDRLRKCVQCDKWFVDKSDNKKARFCSNDCHDAHWNRFRRQKAGHKGQPKERNTRKKGARS